MKILRNSFKHKNASDKVNYLAFDLTENRSLLPASDFRSTIDEYEQYVKEKDNCNKYNFIFTVDVLATNVLFNSISEIVYNEGSDDTIYFGLNGGNYSDISDIVDFQNYKGVYNQNNPKITRDELIRDTSYSHKDIGKLVYHCGYDIFGNHFLRKKGFSIINKLNTEDDVEYRKYFNTLSDWKRDKDGNTIEDNLNTIKISGKVFKLTKNKDKIHRYIYDDLYSIQDSIKENFVENDGWFGFINKQTLKIPNYVDDKHSIIIDKCMNNNKSSEQIDMYPDRTLFYIKPKLNRNRKRVEYNWEYCITYPYKNYYNNSLVGEDFEYTVSGETKSIYINGLECEIITSPGEVFEKQIVTGDSESDEWYLDEYSTYKDDKRITFRTSVRHNLSEGDYIKMFIFDDDNNTLREMSNDLRVVSIGFSNEYDENTFTVTTSDFDVLSISDVGYTTNAEGDKEYVFLPTKRFRFRKVTDGYDCKYYIRLFKRLPNFKNTEVYNDDIVTSEEIDKYCLNDFSSSLNNLAFSTNIYGDPIGQIIFNDPIDTTGIYDNLGRELSELYLTFIKTNKGHKEWYDDNDYTNKNIEYSHCFGDLTAGYDLLPYSENYNVHLIHNIDVNVYSGKTFSAWIGGDYVEDAICNTIDKFLMIDESPKNLEENNGSINISGDTSLSGECGNGVFFGDIVELSISNIEETILEDVQYRFNTAQREYTKDYEFYNFKYDDIVGDDFKLIDISTSDIDDGFKVSSVTYNNINTLESRTTDTNGKRVYFPSYPFNLNPEGYYYNPHKRIEIKDFVDTISQGNHTKLAYSIDSDGIEGNNFVLEMSKDYFLNVNDRILFYKKTVERLIGDNISIEDSLDEADIIYGTVTAKTSNYIVKVKIDNKVSINITEYNIFKYNKEKPSNAIDLCDGYGTYIWRKVKSEINYTHRDNLYDMVFTNGKKYIHDNIDVYVRRQDPYGDYGLNYVGKNLQKMVTSLIPTGNDKPVDTVEEVNDEKLSVCGIDFTSEITDVSDSLIKNSTNVLKKTVNNMKDISKIIDDIEDIVTP